MRHLLRRVSSQRDRSADIRSGPLPGMNLASQLCLGLPVRPSAAALRNESTGVDGRRAVTIQASERLASGCALSRCLARVASLVARSERVGVWQRLDAVWQRLPKRFARGGEERSRGRKPAVEL
jgi:hypothetical protein